MDTPIFNFLESFKNSGFSRFHMPGHKGNMPFFDFSQYDITEINKADCLFYADGIIKQSQDNASKLFGTYSTVYSTAGSTLGIQTMLLLSCKKSDKIICSRNSHIAFYNACALFDFIPIWVYPDYYDEMGVSGCVTSAQIEKKLIENPDSKVVYITSPDYMGNISDIKGIANVCEKHSATLLVDNAHGAHLKFMNEDLHPITLGAAMCCDSAHKTLPVLTGGGYVHSSKKFSQSDISSKMSMIASTSPSYLILASLDLCNKYLHERAHNDFNQLSIIHDRLFSLAKQQGFKMPKQKNDITKLILNTYSIGHTGYEIAEFLRQNKIEPEYVSSTHVVILMTNFNSKTDFDRLEYAIKNIKAKKPIKINSFNDIQHISKLTPHEAFFQQSKVVDVENSLDKICCETKITCPPGIPIVAFGEVISKDIQKLLKNSGINSIKVLK